MKRNKIMGAVVIVIIALFLMFIFFCNESFYIETMEIINI